MSYKAYKYRVYPTKQQRAMMARFFGCTRFVWNFFLTMKQQEYHQHYVAVGKYACMKELTKLKQDEDYLWLYECDSTSLQAEIEFLQKAYEKFWKEGAGFPKFKSRKEHRDSYTSKCINGNIRLDARYITLPKVGRVRTKVSRPTEGTIKTATVSRTPSGKYYVSVVCDVPDYEYSFSGNDTIGIDLGVKDYCITSNGEHVPNPKYLEKALHRLAVEQKRLSRKSSVSRRYEKQRVKVAKCHERVTNLREDFQHQLSHRLITENAVIGAESLSVKELLQKSDTDLSRRIQDCGWSSFLNKLQYKALWYERQCVQIDSYFPSSQLCSHCGHQNTEVKDLSVRHWICPVCGTAHDRDENAALNIKKEALRILSTS